MNCYKSLVKRSVFTKKNLLFLKPNSYIYSLYLFILCLKLYQFSFSLIGFLSVLKKSEWQKVTIEGKWISELWESSERAFIEKQYELNGFQIMKLENKVVNACINGRTRSNALEETLTRHCFNCEV